MRPTSIMLERAIEAYWDVSHADVDASIYAALEAALGALPMELERQSAELTTLPPASEVVSALTARITALKMTLEEVRQWASHADLRASDAKSLRRILEGAS